MEFTECYCGSDTTKAIGAVALDHADSWEQFTTYHLSDNGVIH